MENLNNYTKIELLKIGNDIKLQHDKLKEVIIVDVDNMGILESRINENVLKLALLEKNYVEIVEKIED